MTQQAGTFGDFDKIQQKVETLGATTAKVSTDTLTNTKVRAKTATAQAEKSRSVLDNVLVSGWLNWETVAWTAIIVLAIVTRMWDLGPRAMHHDESIHANFSYGMYKGTSIVKYDPVYHGPFLYYNVAFSFFIFGASEAASRFPPAFWGVLIVVMGFFARALVGKTGAIVLGVLLLFSPSILYYSRSLRHDIFAVFGEFLLVVGTFRFMQTKPGKKGWWLFLAGAGLAIIYSSHEMVFLNVAIIVGFMAVALAFEMVALPKRIRNKTGEENKPEEITFEKDYNLDELDESDENKREGAMAFAQNEIEREETASERGTALSAKVVSYENDEEETPSLVRNIVSNRRTMSYFFMAIFGLIVAVGAVSYLTTIESTQGALGLITRYIFWLALIPLVAGASGYLISLGFERLNNKTTLIGLIAGTVSFLGIAGLLVYRATRPPKATTAGVAGSANTTTVETAAASSDLVLLGLKLPSLVLPLFFALIAGLFVGLVVAWLWQRRLFVYTQKGIYGFAIGFFTVMFVATLVSLRFTSPVPGKNGEPAALPKGNILFAGPEIDKWLAYVLNGAVIGIIFGAIVGWVVSWADVLDDDQLVGSGMLRGLLRIARRPWMAGAFVLGFALIYVPLFSNFFFYPEGLADGIYKGVEVWAGAHDIRRLDQPWFYYPWMMFLYETVATFVYLVAFVAMPVQFIVRAVRKQKIGFSVKGVFAGLMLWWAALAMVVYSIAGEKAPWLNMQIALPATIAAAIFLDGWLRRVDWRGLVKPTGGLLFLGLMGLLLAATFVIIGLLVNLSPAQVNSNLRIQQIIELVIVAIVAMVLFGSIYWLWRSGRIKGTLMRASIALIFIGLLLAYEVRSTIALNYAHPDTAVEIMIYVQTTPEVPLLMQRLDRLARDVRDTNKLAPPAQGATQADPSNSRGLPVLVTQEVAWPMVWYLRDYTNVSYTAPNTDYNSSVQALPLQDSRNNDYAVIMLQGYENNTKVQELLRDKYTATTFKMRWWFPEDDSGYGGLGVVPPGSTNPNLDKKKIQYTDWAKWWRAVSEQPYAGQLWRFLMYRELPQPLQAVEMVVYVRNDLYPDFNLTNNTGGSNTAIGAGTGTNVQPTAGTTQQVFALTESTGAGNRNGQYKTPRGITIAPNGDFLVMDSGNGRVQRFAPDGTFISKFGNIGTGDGQFQVAQFDGGAGGIATDEEGNIYVADSWNYRIQKFDKDGKFLLKWGSGFDTKGELNINAQNPYGLYGPRGLAYDAGAGELYVADTGNRRVLIFDKQGKYLRQFGSKGSGQAQFDEPVGIALSPDGKVFVSDLRNKRIQIFDKQGKYLNEFKVAAGWQEQPLSEPYMTFDKQGILYVSDSPNGRIYKYTADGQFLQTIENQTGAPMVNPVGLVINPADGFLYVADAKRNAVVKVKP